VYGKYKLRDLNISVRGLRIWSEFEDFYRYRRVLENSEIEKIISKDSEIIINPIEPVNLPKGITNYLFIDFEKPIVIEPDSTTEVFTTFPIEIGVFVCKDETLEDIDIFSFVKPKYALYGDPKGGKIARYWKTRFFGKIPQLDPLEMGVMKLRIYNLTNSWCEVSKAVFDVYGMKIYYNEKLVSSIAEMKIHSKKVAETNFIDEPLFKGMEKAVELYVARKIPIMSLKMTMEWGI